MERAGVANVSNGNAKVEVFGLEGSDGKERSAFAHWFTEPLPTGQAGDLVDGPYPSRRGAEVIARTHYGELEFSDVPDGVDPLVWADVPDDVRAELERRLGVA